MKALTAHMKPFIFTAALLLLSPAIRAADKAGPEKTIFHISGLECASCAYSVQCALTQTPGIVGAEVVQTLDSFARVSFDPKVISAHQIAQVVRDAFPLHGTPYLPTMKLRIRGYSQEGRAAKVKAMFERWKKWVELEEWDAHEGECFIHFLPLVKDAKSPNPQGWRLAQLTEALQAPAPVGLGLEFQIVEPGLP